MRTTCAGIALGLCLLVGSCDRTPLATCTYAGVTYKAGEKFSAGDACNYCSCGSDGVAMCTGMACPREARPWPDAAVPDGPGLSCPIVNPSSAGTVLQGQVCSGTMHCAYVIEKCTGYSDVEWSCDCQSGHWQCNRGYDCPRGDGPPRDTSAICVGWKDMGIDCCDVCTDIYVTCNSSVTDKQKKPLTGQECLTTCGGAGLSYNFYQCMAFALSCDLTKLQECFDKTQL